MERLDVVVVGAGISGISMGYHLRKLCPTLRFAILERRENLGGTWDLNRYPGIRSDSDMFTFGFWWRPWPNTRVIAPREDIIDYLTGAVDDEGLREYIRFNTGLVSAAFSTATQLWTLTTTSGNTLQCSHIHMATGYYSYESPYKPDIPGLSEFPGLVVHPQEWTEADTAACNGKRVAVIGSGATAATLIPALAPTVEHVTMVQRSPTYFVARSAEGSDFTQGLHRWAKKLSDGVAHKVSLWQMVIEQRFGYWFARKFPQTTKAMLIKGIKGQVPEDFDVSTHFNPSYNPWDQRICLVPNGDFFEAVRDGKASVVTGHIKTVTRDGITMEGGESVPADVIVTATGLTLQTNFPMSTVDVTVDGQPYIAPEHFIYKGFMISDVPNMTFTIGYANASWTLKADITSDRVCRLLQFMRANKKGCCVPDATGVERAETNMLGLTSGYLKRAEAYNPKVGAEFPWDAEQNYLLDLYRTWPWEQFDDGNLKFSPRPPQAPAARL